ncbi:zinc finger HIT domain-containing protein 3-like [Ornithodoros turicata]|uniref:zinc finger HIT domain-containing protein 3-like n=1 Tax=Ornithodoros turicata TaxID=34597 RepID=UPI0031390660
MPFGQPCDVCLVKESNYKCPVCLCKYCSLNCYKNHKESCVKTEPTKTADAPVLDNDYRFVTEDTVPIEKLEQLRTSKKVREVLQNPHLRRVMEALDASIDPRSLIDQAMKEPIFVEFADACLQVVDN